MRLIDADALLLNSEQYRCGRGEYSRMVDVWHIENAPTVDAVPVVRCKDCKWYKDFGSYHRLLDCTHRDGLSFANEDNFCCFGERKDDD